MLLMMSGLAACIAACTENAPLFASLSPQEVKKSLCGARDASKEDVRRSLENRYGDVILKGLLKGEASSSQEHAYDSLAVTVACLDSDAIRLVRRISCAD
jgi:Holliday junction resolvasome RuvABC endonuclease subunit